VSAIEAATTRGREEPPASLRTRLRTATAAVHQRLHGHPGFAAAANGHISLDQYKDLLARLYGFHRPFENAMAEAAIRLKTPLDIAGRGRAALIEADLRALGMSTTAIGALQQCPNLKPAADEAGFLGALYVAEGSTLGGVHIARALKTALGPNPDDKLRFFLGYGERQSTMWRTLVARLESLAGDETLALSALDSAVTTFGIFEDWMRGWRSRPSVAVAGPEFQLNPIET
jgi:heme oxygenase